MRTMIPVPDDMDAEALTQEMDAAYDSEAERPSLDAEWADIETEGLDVILRGALATQRIWGKESSARPDPSGSHGSPSG